MTPEEKLQLAREALTLLTEYATIFKGNIIRHGRFTHDDTDDARGRCVACKALAALNEPHVVAAQQG